MNDEESHRVRIELENPGIEPEYPVIPPTRGRQVIPSPLYRRERRITNGGENWQEYTSPNGEEISDEWSEDGTEVLVEDRLVGDVE